MRVRFPHEFDSSWTCNYCGRVESFAIGNENCPERLELALKEAEARNQVAPPLHEVVARLIEADPHQWSSRPCSTCLAVTAIVGRDFGCIKKAKER